MSLRYTATASMDEAVLRGVERNAETSLARWKDKIEVRLDNRQVFFLFFGSAVVACMLFVLGVIVGKRIESRGRAEAPDVQDPLAVLDRASGAAAGPAAAQTGVAGPTVPTRDELTFPKALIGGNPRARALAARLAVASPAVMATPKPLPAAPKPLAVAPVAKPAVASVAKPAAASVAKPAAAPVPRAPAPPAVEAVKPAAKPRFTLHLSTFASKDEADAFARRYSGAFVVGGDAPGKGPVFRVRVGSFTTYQEATAAKLSFEKENHAIALVATR